MATTHNPDAGAKIDERSMRSIQNNLKRVREAVAAGMFAPAIEAACRVVVAEAKRADRPLAWRDVTGNLRASISFQVEGFWVPPPFAARDGSGQTYNLFSYVSGRSRNEGVYGVVYAPPEYAVHVEMKSTRSVLLEPFEFARLALKEKIAGDMSKEWREFVFKESLR